MVCGTIFVFKPKGNFFTCAKMANIHNIIQIKSNNVEPEKGKILISEPFLLDYYFKRSVVLLAEHNEEGSFGLIINKPIDIKFNSVIKDFPDFNSRIYLGGPVQNENIYFIHTLGEQIDGSLKIMEGLFWGGDLEQVKEMILLKKIGPDDIRFFVGYSGWVSKQLEGELKRNSWLVSSTDINQVMQTNPNTLWNDSVLSLGGNYAYWVNFPSDPGHN